MTARPEPPCAIASWCALGLGHEGGCSIARPRGNRTPVDVLVKAGLALLELGVSTKQLTQADFILFPDPVGGSMSNQPAADAAQGAGHTPADPGTSAAYEESAHTAQSYAYRYKKLAGQVAELIEEIGHLADLDIRNPDKHSALFGRYRPSLLASTTIKGEDMAAASRLERVQLYLQGCAGAWETEAARLRFKGAQLEAEEFPAQTVEPDALAGFPQHNHAPASERVPGCPLCDVAAEIESKGGDFGEQS